MTLHRELQQLQQLPTQWPITDTYTESHWERNEERARFSLLVELRDLHFNTHIHGVEGVELLGIPIEKEHSNLLELELLHANAKTTCKNGWYLGKDPTDHHEQTPASSNSAVLPPDTISSLL